MRAKFINENKEIEKLADVEHKGWSRWMKYLFSVSKENEDGTITIPKNKVDRWKRQMNTDYKDLSNKEKESDRKEVRKFLKVQKMNENMGYETIFGKVVSHEEALQKRIRDLITNIVTEERGISEKAFSSYDDVMNEVKNICDNNSEIYEWAQDYYDSGSRLNLLAEEIYEKYFKK